MKKKKKKWSQQKKIIKFALASVEPGMSWLEGRCTYHYTNGPYWQRQLQYP